MRKRFVLATVVLASALVSSACGSTASTPTSTDPTALATELIGRYGDAVFDRDQAALGELLSDAYLLRRTDGSGYDRDGYIKALGEGSDYKLGDFEVSDVKARMDGDILVATFTLDAAVQENGRSVISDPTQSLVTFVKVDGEWKLASDAFFTR